MFCVVVTHVNRPIPVQKLGFGFFLYSRFGPASKYWCMRFEAKHSYFKSLAHKVKCFKNIAKTMCDRHQTLMCYIASSENDYNKDLSFGVVK